LDDESKEAKLCKEQYEKQRDDLLRAHKWNFAIGRQQLAKSTDYVPPFKYESAFPYPANVLRVLKLDVNEGRALGEREWAIEMDPSDYKKYIVCNEGSIAIEAIYRVPESRFETMFAEVLATKIASDLAYALTNSSQLKALLFDQYKNMLADARAFDAQEASVPKAEDDDFLAIRLAGGPGFIND
jgi:hypothetical protein